MSKIEAWRKWVKICEGNMRFASQQSTRLVTSVLSLVGNKYYPLD